MTIKQKHEIYDRYMAGGVTYKELAEEYGITMQGVGKTVRSILLGKRIRGSDQPQMQVRPENVICPKLERWRQEHNMTQDDLARACGVSRPTIRSILYRHDKEMRPYGPCQKVLLTVSKVTGIALDDLVYRKDE